MLSCIVSKLTGSAAGQDLVNCLLTNQQLQAAVRAARVTCTLTEHQQHVLSNPSHAGKLDDVVKALTKYFKGGRGDCSPVSIV